ncbi:hypothetical protein Dimus_020158 [Dionaea muscipula]
MVKNGLERMMELIKRQKWEKLFAKRDLVFKTKCREFYKNLKLSVSWKKEVAKSKVNGVEIEFDGITLVTILEILGNSGLCDYIKEEWEPSRFCNPLENTRMFANNRNILEARSVKSVEIKPFHRFLQIFVMKNLVPRFGKRDITSFMDLAYMGYLLSRRKINLPRVIIRHMEYMINVPNHELPYGELLTRIFEAFHVPLNSKKGEDPKRYDFFEETFLTICQMKRENGVWWLGTGNNRRRDDENEEVNVEENFNWEAVIDEVELQEEEVNDEAAIQGEQMEREAEVEEFGSGEKYFDAVDEERPNKVDVQVPDVPASASSSMQ